MTKLSDEMLETLVNRLEGQCRLSPEQALEEAGLEPTDDRVEQLIYKVFCCEGCGWYASTEELNNNGPDGRELCDECSEDPEDE